MPESEDSRIVRNSRLKGGCSQDWLPHMAAKKAQWRGLHEVRREYPSADQVGGVLIFDVLGNNYRLITRVKYNLQRIYVKALLTHREYDRKGWMKWV